MGLISAIKKIISKKSSSQPSKIPPYAEIVETIKIDDSRLLEAKTLAQVFFANQERYEVVSQRTEKFPVDLLFAIHYRESSLSFKGVLHNGDQIIGTGKLTTHVPKGRGPFNTWEDAATDAILLEKGKFPSEWSFENKLLFAELYNGIGYRKTSEYSPYVFSGTNFSDETGKYVADGHFDPDAKEKQLGVAAILLAIGKV